jgi:cytochrome c-type biogenesis protein CcmH/NrfF
MVKTKRVLVLAVVLSFAMVPLAVNLTAETDRARHVGLSLKCMCKGCDMSAGGCSHPGGTFTGPCETAKGMLKEVDAHIARGETDQQIIQAFVNEYGTIVYMVPPKTGFGLVAWLMPIAYVVFGVGSVVFFMRKWSRRKPATAGHAVSATGPNISADALARARAQANRETED